MKIALVTADYPPIEGGLSRLSADLATSLHESGYLSGVLAPQIPGGEEHDRNLPFPIVRFPGYSWGVGRIVPGFLRSGGFRKAVLSKTGHLLAINPSFGGLYGWMGKKWGTVPPYSLFAYGYEFLKFAQNPLAKATLLAVYRNAASVFAISRFTRDALIDYGVPSEKVFLAPLGVNTRCFHPETLPGKAIAELSPRTKGPVLLTVGRLIPRKNHLQVLRCLKRLRVQWPGIEYWIVGRGPEEKRLKDFVRCEGLQEQVRFWGLVGDSDLPRFYRACDLFVLPARQDGPSVEGLGLVLQEAAACGKPTLGGRSGGISEAMIEGSTGLLVDPEDVGQLENSLRSLLSSPERMKRMGRAGYQWVKSERNWELCIARLVRQIEATTPADSHRETPP